jgi:HAD superfamily hydrolase (TIGR01490 family)
MQKVAFFDIDGTVFRSSLLIELVDALIRKGIFPEKVGSMYATTEGAWKDRKGTYRAYIGDVIRVFECNIQGVHYGTLKDIGKEVVEAQGGRIYRYTRDLIHTLKEDGYAIVAISQSPKVIVDAFCMQYGFDKVYGRIYEIGPRDLLTGVVIDEELIKDKSLIVERCIVKEGYTLLGSYGIGDTDSDIPLLEMVEHPLCFNPNRELYTHAKSVGWSVVVERKDVVYTLS